MEKDGNASIAVVRRHEPRFFSLLRCDTKRRKGEGAWFCLIVSRWVLECPIVTTEENGEITRLKVDDSHIGAPVAIEVAGKSKIRPRVGAGIVPWLEGSIPYSQEGCKAVLHAVDHKEIADPVMIEVGETDSEGTLPCPVVCGRAKGAVAVPHPD